ncbi:hypothetical protein DXF96_09115 [Heyndrickxia coagulans]|nr:hypothetical protein CYJ15_03565 [Heyndrickxia coagulans]KYC89416.1 hypothetical protein B4096_0745 [Heyndrickxia coagulans]QDI61620.1 hypothetical protein DXF96_09115 [Heyndrickxia coagulans]
MPKGASAQNISCLIFKVKKNQAHFFGKFLQVMPAFAERAIVLNLHEKRIEGRGKKQGRQIRGRSRRDGRIGENVDPPGLR